jgi:adenosylcobinamide-GDP ribazoletransferase
MHAQHNNNDAPAIDLGAPGALLGRYGLRPLVSAIRILTIIPVPGKDSKALVRALPFFPVVGLALGMAARLAGAPHALVDPHAGAIFVLIALGLTTGLTGAIHLDGLADVADGLGGARTPERILAIFHDSRIGSFGAVAVVFDILVKWWCWRYLFEANLGVLIVSSLAVARWLQACALGLLPKAAAGGLASVFRTSSGWLKSAVVAGGLCVIAPLFAAGPLLPAVFGLFCAIAAASAFSWHCVQRIGGLTGDCVGAINEIAEASFLAAAVVYIAAR